jgi:2-keto-myo-inositol isomerase
MPFSYCLNTSTIRSEGSTILDMIDTTADAGWDGIEPWVKELDDWIAGGGTLDQVRARAEERNLAIVNLIGFPEWAVPEDDRRAAGFAEAARCFEMAKALGCPHVAAPPFGIHDRVVDILPVADHFADLVDLAAKSGVSPLLEYWGIAKTLGRTGEVLLVAAECGRSGVQLLADVFHMYKGSGHHVGFEHFGTRRLGLVHVNDYPATPARADVTDADRVYPGDGLAPWQQIISSLKSTGFTGMLSLELFNESYWARGPAAVAREGLAKLKGCVGTD